MNKDDFDEVLGGVIGKGKIQKYYHINDSKDDMEKLEGYIRQFIFENKLGGRLKFYQGENQIFIESTEQIKLKLNAWLEEVNTEYGFRPAYL